MSFHESPTRSITKTITYRLLIIISNFLITYFLTGSLEIATGVAGVSFLVNTGIYYVHERVWNTVRWGKGNKK
jgi:uncharacterized membrane protein